MPPLQKAQGSPVSGQFPFIEVCTESVYVCGSAWLHGDEMEIKLASDNQRFPEPLN